MVISASGGSLSTPKYKFLNPKFFGHGLVVLLMLILYSFTYGQSSDCSYSGTAITVGTSCSYTTFNSSNNSDYWNSPNGCNAADRDDAWWYFTATGTSTTITYNPDSRDAILHLFTGSCSSSMSYLACADDFGNGGAETISAYPTVIGVQYAIRIQRWNSNNNMFGDICVWSPPSGPPSCVIAPLSPADGAVDVSLQPTLEWPAAIGATSYDVYFGTSPIAPPLVSASQAGTTYTPASLLNELATYYWMIVPKNSSGDAIGCSTWSFKTGEGGCLTAPYGQYPTTASYDPYVPSCTGSAETITTMGYAGEYSKVEVTSGTEYIFKSSVSTDLVTISDETGTTVYDYDLWGVTWTATITGIVRFYTHTDADCGSATSMRARTVQCSQPPPANDECADATSLPCGTSALAGTTVNSVSETSPAGSTVSGYGVWYTFSGDDVPTTISVDASFDHAIVIMSGSCGSLSLIAEVDQYYSGSTESYSFTPASGTDYYVYVAHYQPGNTTTGTITISRDCFPPPANDECANATSITCSTTDLAGTTVNAIAETPPGSYSDYGVWYTFTGDGLYTTISTVGTTMNQAMTIAYGSCGSLTVEANVNDNASSSGGTETYSFYPTNGVDYYVYVTDYQAGSTTTGTFTITRTCPSAPANDACAAATSLPCSTSGLAGTTVAAVAESAPSTSSDYGVWYTFTGDGVATTISTVGTTMNQSMTILYGSCGSLTLESHVDSDASSSGGTETYSFTPTNGINYYIYVSHYLAGSTTVGTFTISRDCFPPPANDECADATSITCSTTDLAGTTVNAVAESAPGSYSDYGVWYKFTGDGVYTTISTVGTTMNQAMTIAYGSCGSLTVEANVNDDASASGGTETYSFYPTNGVDYYVYVSYYLAGSTTTGTFTITRTCTAAPANDDCSNATSLPCATTDLAGTTVATIAESAPLGLSSDYGVWYTFTGDGVYTTISSVAASMDHEMTILYGSCGSLTGEASVDAAGSGGTETYTFYPTNGVEYFVYISHDTPGSTTQSTFTISRSCTAAPANDECSGATNLPCGTTDLAGTTLATIAETPPSSTSDFGVWYEFSGDDQSTTISSTSSIFLDHEMTILSGTSCGSFTVIADVDGAAAGGTESYTFTSVTGTQYYVFVAHATPGSTVQSGFTISRSCVVPPPANDDCSNATSLPCATTDLDGTTVNTIGESAPGNYASDYGVWYTFTGDGLLTDVSATGESGFDIEMTIVYGSCGSYSIETTQDATGTGGTESYLFYPTNGTDYFVYIAYQGTGGSSSQTGAFTISRVCYPPPANDECVNATNLPCGTTDLAGSTIGAIAESAPSTSSSYGVWYEFTGTGEATTISSTASASYDHELTIMSGSCGGLTVIANVDAAMSGGTETYTFHSAIGTQYYIYVAHYSTSSGQMSTFTISRSCLTNDICDNATAFSLTCGGSYSDASTTAEATNTSNGGTCTTSASTARATWYSFTGTGFDVTASLCGSSYDTKIFVYSGACGVLSCVIGNDDACSLQSEVTFTSTYGTTYYIMVAGYSSNSGAYTLNVTDAGVLPTGVDAGANVSICNNGSSTDLNGSYSTGSGILWSPATGLSSTTVLDPVATPTTTTVYTLTIGTDACAVSDSVTITVDEPSVEPSSISGPSTPVCLGTTSTLTTVGGTLQSGDWQWYEGSCASSLIGTGSSIDVTPTTTSTYYVQAPASGACPATICTSKVVFVGLTTNGLATNGATATCPMNQSGYIHLQDASGFLIASVDPQGQNLGDVTATVYVEGSPIVIDNCSAVGNPIYQVSVADRHYTIKSTVAPSSNVKVRLPISENEVNSLNVESFNNLNPDDQVGSIDDIEVTKYSGANEDNDFSNDCAVNGGSGQFPLISQDNNGFVYQYIDIHDVAHLYIEYTVSSFSEFWMHGSVSGSGLPVEMANFNATCLEPGITEVSWETITEQNSSHFELYKSNDGNNWTLIHVVDAAGDSQEPIPYSVTDEIRNDIDGIVYYRIEQFDNDGMSKSYDAVSVSCASANSDMLVYPNPGSGNMNIVINEEAHIGICSLEITDSQGKTIHLMDVEINKGNNSMHIDGRTLKPGIYFIKVYNEDYTTKTIRYSMTEN